MKRRWFGVVGVCFVCGCSAGGKETVRPRVPESPARSSSAGVVGDMRVGRDTTPARDGGTEHRRTNELGTPAPDDRFGVAHQVSALERSIELYQAFIARAGDDERYAEAVRRSLGRIEDARLTICFLLERPCDTKGSP